MATLALDERLRGLEARKGWTAGALLAAAIGYALMAGTEVLELAGLVDLTAENPDPLTTLALLAALLSVVAAVVSIILVCVWTHRAHATLAEAGYEKQFTPGWAVGWYFVPFANLVMPFRAMREAWNLSHGQADSIGDPAPSILTQWWACWLIGNIVSNIGLRLEGLGTSAGLMVGLVGSIALAASAWLLRDIVIRITAAQRSVVGISQTFA